MMKNKLLLITVMLVLVFALAMPSAAEDKAEKKKENFYGSFELGYRGVDTSGHESKYKEDVNLNDGPRLFSFSLHYLPENSLKKYFDRLDISLHNFGGDPFESFDLSIVKYGAYKFKYDRRKSAYFYEDNFVGHDLHNYDFDRVMDTASLKLWLTNYAHLYFDFERNSKTGNSTTSLDVSHDEFEFEKPIDESSKELSLGLDVVLTGFTFKVEEKIRDYVNDYRFFLADYGYGEDAGDPTELSYFFFNQPYDFRSFTHTGLISARPTKNLLLKASAVISSQDMRVSYSEAQEGTTYLGTPLKEVHSGSGNFDRKTQMYDLDLTYLISDNLAFTGAVRYHNFEQDGTYEIYDVEMPNQLDYNTLGMEAGLQYQVSGDVSVAAGFRSESREVSIDEEDEATTKRTGFYGNLKVKLAKDLNLTADYQMGSYKDPYTAVSPTDLNRVRVTARYKLGAFNFSSSYLYQLTENDIEDGWRSERNQLNARAGFYNKTVKLSLGYGMIYTKNEGDRHFMFYGSPRIWSMIYEGRSNLLDAYLHLFLSKKITFGAYLNYYKNDGTWEVTRFIAGPFLQMDFEGGFMGKLVYKYIDFKENVYGNNNYTANIFEISFGYRW